MVHWYCRKCTARIHATLDLSKGKSVRSRFFEGLRRLSPASQLETWDVGKIFTFIAASGAPADKDIQTLRDHTAALMALYLGCRASDRARLLRKHCVREAASGLLVRFYDTKELKALRKSTFTDWSEVKTQEDPFALLLITMLTWLSLLSFPWQKT